jgi:hypothetical protein
MLPTNNIRVMLQMGNSDSQVSCKRNLQPENTENLDVLHFWKRYEHQASGFMVRDIIAVPIAGVWG